MFVQAAGAVIAAMHSPQHILQATRKGMFLVGINSLDPTDPRWTDTVRMAFAKAAMMDPDEAEAMADAAHHRIGDSIDQAGDQHHSTDNSRG